MFGVCGRWGCCDVLCASSAGGEMGVVVEEGWDRGGRKRGGREDVQLYGDPERRQRPS